MAQSAVLGFGLAPQIKGLGGGVDRKWQGVGVKKEYAGKSQGIRVPLHRGPPALRFTPNQKPFQSLPRVQKPPEEEGDAEVGEEGPQPTYNKAPLADPPPASFPQRSGYPYPDSAYPYNSLQHFNPNVGYRPQQFNPNVGYPQQIYPPQQPDPRQYIYPQQIYPPQQPDPQQYIYPPQQPNPRSPRRSKWSAVADVVSIIADISDIVGAF